MEIIKKIKEELEVSKNAKNIIIECLFLGLIIFLSVFWGFFSIIGLFIGGIFILLNRNGKSAYFLFFLLPMVYIFRIESESSYFLSYLAGLVVLILSIKTLIQIITKQVKIKKGLSIVLACFVIYSLVISLKNHDYFNILSVFLGLALIYILTYYKEDLNFKELSFVFFLGIVFSIIIGLFHGKSTRLQEFIPLFYAEGSVRFTGVSINTNVFALDLMVLFSLFLALYIKNDIRFLFYPILFFVSLLTPMLLGKTSFIIYLILLLISVIFMFVKHKGNWYIIISFIILSFILIFVFEKDRIFILLKRLNINIGKDNLTYYEWESSSDKLDYITTGRFDIIKTYLSKLLASPLHFIFGYGFGAEYLTIDGGVEAGHIAGAHNVYIEIIYTIGILGFVLLLSYLLFLVFEYSKRPLTVPFIIILLPVALFAVSLSFFSYRLFNYILFALVSLNSNTREIDKLSEINSLELSERFELEDESKENLKPYTNQMAILTPAYNRAELLKRTYESLKNQTSKNFVWYIVDDGSSDNTEQVVKDFIKESKKEKDFEIIYTKKENGGKHTALNVGLKQIKENYVIILDSDDYLTNDAVETILQDIQLIDDKNEMCGLGYLRIKEDGSPIGKVYTQDGVVDTFINQRYNKNTYGDKAEVFKTGILKQFPFPEFENEKFVSESTVWCAMSGKYKMMFFNKGIYICEYQEGGLSDGIHKRLFKNPKGSSACYRQMSTKDFCFKLRVKYTIAYIVYSLEAGMSLKEMKENHSQNKFLISLLYIPSKIYHKKLKRRYE